MNQLSLRLTAVLFAITLAACSKAPKLQTVLEADEDIATGSQVTLNDRVVGKVVDVGREGGERVANFVIEDKDAADRMQKGLYRVKDSGKVALQTDLIKEGAKPLARGARVPVKGKVTVIIEKYGTLSNIIVAGSAVLSLLILARMFRKLVGEAKMVMCCVLAGVGTQFAVPYATPYVKTWLDHWAPPQIPAEYLAPSGSSSGSETESSGDSYEVIDLGEGAIIGVASRRPSPWLVTWSAVFLIFYLVLNVLFARAEKST